MTENAFFITFALAPLGSGAFLYLYKNSRFGLTIEHWQFDMVCQKCGFFCAISSGLDASRTAKKIEDRKIKILRHLFTIIYLNF